MKGGYRPGAGRPRGVRETKPRKRRLSSDGTKIKELLSLEVKAKARLYKELLTRIEKGDVLTISEKKTFLKLGNELEAATREKPPASIEIPEQLDPLGFMLKVMRDPNEPKERRDRMAIAAAPFCHARKGEAGTGLKDEKQKKARIAGAGRFAAGSPPLKVVK